MNRRLRDRIQDEFQREDHKRNRKQVVVDLI